MYSFYIARDARNTTLNRYVALHTSFIRGAMNRPTPTSSRNQFLRERETCGTVQRPTVRTVVHKMR